MQIDQEIHKTPYRVVMAVTGGGSEVIGDLLHNGNGSATLIEAIVPYSADAMDDFLGGKPDKYCSASTARAMAMRAFQRAAHLSDGKDVIGIGATCKLVKGMPERKGRIHEIYVASQTDNKTVLATVELKYPRSRHTEEQIAARLIMNILARSCGVGEYVLPIYPDKGESLELIESDVNTEIQDVVCGRTKFVRIPISGSQHQPKLVFPGSFNPLHKNHIEMARRTFLKEGHRVDFEISIENVDKPALDYITIQERLNAFKKYASEPWMGHVYLTISPLFAQKADLFPGAAFIVGYDTLVRISDPRYYLPHEFEATMKSFQGKGTRFIAFHRLDVDVSLSAALKELTDIISPEDYVDDGTSSSKIRNGEK